MNEIITKRWHRFAHQIRCLWLNLFWLRPDNLWALKVTLAIAIMVIPSCLFNAPFIGCTLALGSVGAALAETDDHPLGRWRSLVVTIISFVIVSLAVESLRFYPWIFGICLGLTTFWLIILGGLSTRYQGITFGALLVFVYAMLGAGICPWYYQPILLPLGGLMYGSISLLLLTMRPYRLIKEPLKKAYYKLADYIDLKASMFPCSPEKYRAVQTDLASKNIYVEQCIDAAKDVIYAYLEVLVGKHCLDQLAVHYRQWMLLQQLHERATSTHQRYDILSKKTHDVLLLEGMGQYLHQLAKAIRSYGDSIITGHTFVIHDTLRWTGETTARQLELAHDDPEYDTLALLHHNLSKMTALLEAPSDCKKGSIPVDELAFRPEPFKIRLTRLLDMSSPRFRHAVRLTICLVLGYAIVEGLEMSKGTWVVLTSIFVCQQSYVATRQRLTQRILGTVSGVVLGVVLSRLMPTIGGQVVLLLGSIYLFFYWLRKRYAYAVIFITSFVVAAFNLQTGSGVAVMGYRLVDTLLGSALAFLTVRYIWPDWQYHRLPGLFRDAVGKSRRYFYTIYATDMRGQAYYHNRRAAHKADNALAQAWRGMAYEPHSKRVLQRQAYALTYLNHALLSYISALGAHNYVRHLTDEEIQAGEHITKLLDRVAELVMAQDGRAQQKAYVSDEQLLDEARDTVRQVGQLMPGGDSRNSIFLLNIAVTTSEIIKECLVKSRLSYRHS